MYEGQLSWFAEVAFLSSWFSLVDGPREKSHSANIKLLFLATTVAVPIISSMLVRNLHELRLRESPPTFITFMLLLVPFFQGLLISYRLLLVR